MKDLIKAAGIAVLLLVVVAMGAVLLGSCTAATPAESAPSDRKGSGSPQDPCVGAMRDCSDSGNWYVTTIKVGERQIPCITQIGYSTKALSMSCDWTNR